MIRVPASLRPTFRRNHEHPWRNGLAAALAQSAAGELCAALLPRARSPVSGIGQTMIDFLPGLTVDMVVATAETKDKAIMRGGLGAAAIGSGRVAAALERRKRGSGQALLLGTGLVEGAAAASRPENSAVTSLLAGFGAGTAGARALAALGRRPGQPRERMILAAGALAAGAAGALRQGQRAAADRRRQEMGMPAAAKPAPPVPPGSELQIPGITPLFTPNEDFYVTDTVLTAPRVDPSSWRLRVCGMVEHELEFSLEQLLDVELVELDASLVCVHNPVGGYRAGAARWLGVPLKTLLASAGVQPDSDQVLAHSVDGFTAGLPIDMVGEGLIPLVALGMNGEPLTVRNGFPARLLTPGLWGADASTKWLSAIELTTWHRASDYWDARGWPRTPGRVKPGSRIDVPADRATISAGSAVVAGIAWAPRSGVEAVEVSIDDGDWERAELSPELAPTLWRQWALMWQAQPGDHQLRVRTLSHDDAQEEGPRPPYPRGASGYHTINVHVEPAGIRPPAWKEHLGQVRADLTGRARLAAMAPPAWRRHGFPRRPDFPEPLPPAHRSVREWLPSNP